MADLPRYPAAFEAFWRACPPRRPNPKEPAYRIWRSLTRPGGAATAEALRAAAAAWAEECRRLSIQPAYIPHARTWLSQGRWVDYVPDPIGAQDAREMEAEAPDHPLVAIAAEIGRASWRSWIAPLVVEHGPGGPVVRAPTRFHGERVRAQYLGMIRRVLGPGVEVVS